MKDYPPAETRRCDQCGNVGRCYREIGGPAMVDRENPYAAEYRERWLCIRCWPLLGCEGDDEAGE